VAGVSGLSGAVIRLQPLSGTVVGVSGMSGAPTALHPLAGSVAGTSALSGNATARFRVSGVVDAISAVSGSIIVEGTPLDITVISIIERDDAVIGSIVERPATISIMERGEVSVSATERG
jgi:hypothetical protein